MMSPLSCSLNDGLGEQHYYSMEAPFGPSGSSNGDRDVTKRSLCQSNGITLIIVPFWWDGEKESISATLYAARPDLFPVSDARPIPQFRESQANPMMNITE